MISVFQLLIVFQLLKDLEAISKITGMIHKSLATYNPYKMY